MKLHAQLMVFGIVQETGSHMLNEHAQALGRLNKGVKKTMSQAAIKQRRDASIKSKLKREETMPLEHPEHNKQVYSNTK